MEIVKLVDFVKIWDFFEKIEWEYEQIISDFDFQWFDGVENFVKINIIWDFDNLDKNKTTLIVLDELILDNVIQLLDMENITILDMNFGLSGYGKKIWMSKIDLWDLIKKDISIYEPYDLVSMLDDIKCNGKKYLRINEFDMPWNFVDIDVNDILSLSDSGFSGGAFTIMTTGTMLSEIVRVAHILNEHWLFVDVFVLNRLDFDLDEKWESLLKHNRNIMFVLDSLNWDNYEKWICNKLKANIDWSRLEDIFNIKFIYPEYNKLSTVFGEYKNEETFFDAVGLVNRLK